MRTILATLFLFSFSLISSQELKRNEIRLGFQPQFVKQSDIFHDHTMERDVPMFEEDYGYDIGLQYNYLISEKLSISMGISYFLLNTIQTHMDGHDNLYYKMIRIPVGLSYDITKWLDLNAFLSTDFQFASDNLYTNQSGLSAFVYPSLKIPLNSSYKFELSPVFTHFRLIGFTNDRYIQQLLSYGVSFSISKCF